MNEKILSNARIVTPFTVIEKGFIAVTGKKIRFLGRHDKDGPLYADLTRRECDTFDMEGKTLLPGFIDIHTHGALGKDYSSSPDMVFEDAVFRASKGVTAFLPTIGCFVSPDAMLESAKRLSALIRQKSRGAVPLGINMEGPFLHPELGAQDRANCFGQVDLAYLRRLIDETGSSVKVATISPELPGAVEGIGLLAMEGIVPAIGHTLASEEELDRAIRAGARLVTHLLNTTYQPVQDIKGVVKTGVNEYLMLRDDIYAEFICDSSGTHINPVMLNILLRCKSADKLVLISDSLLTPGLKEGARILLPDGREIELRNGVNYQTKTNHITGSAMTMDAAFKSFLKFTGVPVNDASITASFNPARILGLEDRKGSLETGKDADIIAVDDDFGIHATFVEGELEYGELRKLYDSPL